MNFIDDLKRFMGCHYLSVADISDLFGISRSTGYRLLNGQKKVTSLSLTDTCQQWPNVTQLFSASQNQKCLALVTIFLKDASSNTETRLRRFR